jgi:hypothetical protein
MGYPERDQPGWDRRERRPPPPRQSSATVACRAMVMIGCLVGLVGAALFGTALPDLVKGLLGGSRSDGTETASQLASEAPPFDPTSSSEPQTWPAPGPQNPTGWPDQRPQGPPQITAAPGQNPPGVLLRAEMERRPPPNNIAPNNIAPITSPRGIPPIDAVQASYESWSGQPASNPATSHQPYPSDVSQFASSPPAHTMSQPDPLAGAMPGGPLQKGPGADPNSFVPDENTAREGPGPIFQQAAGPQPGQPVDRFTYIQTRLRELGATYYLLETWGSGGEYFRFHCRMAVGGSQDCSQQFEATESDALQAMTQVLEKVESWRGSR